MSHYAVLCSIMQAISVQLRDFMKTKGLSQSALAKAAGVNQSTVSRALRQAPARHSEAMLRLCRYAGISDLQSESSTARGAKLVLTSFEKVWDGSDAHATAIARIIDASKGLIPERL